MSIRQFFIALLNGTGVGFVWWAWSSRHEPFYLVLALCMTALLLWDVWRGLGAAWDAAQREW